MACRYLFGPVHGALATDYLARERRAGNCLAFNAADSADLSIQWHDTWEDVRAHFPGTWHPDFITLYLPYRTIPPCLWSASVPIVGLAGDWNLLWHCYRGQLRHCDLVLTDTVGVEQFRKEGHEHVSPWNLYGLSGPLAEMQASEVRDIDILFVGYFQGPIQRQRHPWLARVAELSKRWKVVITTGAHGRQYHDLLARARIVFNRSARGEWNMRVGEALAAGALLFQEAGNREVSKHLAERQECIFYNDDDLEGFLEYYLEHEDERRAIAEAGRARLKEFTFEQLWTKALEKIEEQLPELQKRSRSRPQLDAVSDLEMRTWQHLNGTECLDSTLAADLQMALQSQPRCARLHNCLGPVQSWPPSGKTMDQSLASAQAFQEAWTCDPRHVLAGLNLAEVLAELGRKAEALEQAQRTLAMLDHVERMPARFLDAAHYSSSFDEFRVAWEKAGWQNAGDSGREAKAKAGLLRWRLHGLIGTLTGDLGHLHEAVEARPDLFSSRMALAATLAVQERWPEAVSHLRQLHLSDPFDADISRLLHQALGHIGDLVGQHELAQDCALLHKAAPTIVPEEPWFAEARVHSAKVARSISPTEFHERYGTVDTEQALHSFTPPRDTEIVLTLLTHFQPKRILEIGTAAGHMTANLSEWSPEDAKIFSIGLTAAMPASAPAQQRPEDPPLTAFGAQADHFRKRHKTTLIATDSLTYDFSQIAPIEFAFIDGAHDLRHVWSDSRRVYDNLAPGGVIVWHDFNSPTPWVEVRQALEQLPFSEALEHVEGSQIAFLRKTGAQAAGSAVDEKPVCLVWQGGFNEMHSLALINRELCGRLIARGHDVSLSPTQTVAEASLALPLPPALAACVDNGPDGNAEIHVRHQWPPNFAPPKQGHWVIMQPWEFGSLPKAWIGPFSNEVDEVWVPSRFVRDCFIKSGVPVERVHVVPLGVDLKESDSDEPFPLATRKTFKFLFVGGSIHRKGVDLLLKAYQSTFANTDDVCLVVKDMGVSSFYKGQTADNMLASFRSQPHAPEIEYLDRDLSAEDMDRLYRSCDCLAHPFRGEGFGLPIVEAMAHGLPVIVTGYGPVLDYASPDTAYLLPAREFRLPEKRLDVGETVDYPWVVEPDLDRLRYYLRRVFEHPQEARQKGQAARAFVREHFTWEHTVVAVEARLHELRQRPIRRSQQPQLEVNRYRPEGTRRRAARVSLCMIVKNEEKHLEACLRSVAGLVDEMVIVDTGSSDRTRQIAAGFGAKVIDFTWQDSFAAARNESLKHASGNWILWLDADERLDDVNRQRLSLLLDRLGRENVGYLMRQQSPLEVGPEAAAAVDQVRLFPNHEGLRWHYRVHEQILPSLRQHGAEVRPTDIVIDHVGFAEPTLQGHKVERNLRLLHLELEEHPDDSFVLFNLGAVALTQGRHADALTYLEQSLQHTQPQDSVTPKLHALLVRCHRELGHKDEALALCQRGQQQDGANPELLFWEAILRQERGELAQAEQCLKRLVGLPRSHSFMGLDTGLVGYRGRHFLAEILARQGKSQEAEAEWRAVVAEAPTFVPAWRKLAEQWLNEKRWTDLEQAIRQMHRDPDAALDATLLWCRALLARKDFANARRLVEKVVAANPQHVPARMILSYVFLQEGQDWSAAEKALRDILVLDPNNAEASHNLQVLSQQQELATSDDGVGPAPEVVVYTNNGSPPLVSLSMIVKNEEHNLPACLESVADLVHEIIVVDTGSVDRTKEVAARFGAKIFDFPWVDSFAAARNESLKHATGEWVFWMDADDRLDPENRDRLGRLLANLPAGMAGYAMKCLCVPDEQTKAATVVDHLRLFRNHPELFWKYRVHEQILPALRRLGATVHWSDVVVQHVGYRDGAIRSKKLERDLRLLLMEQAEQPDDPFTLFNLGSVYQELGKLADALPLFKRSLQGSEPSDSIVRKLYALIAQCHNHLGQQADALQACRQGRSLFPEDAELLFQEGITLRHLGDADGAINAWEKLLQAPEGAHFASVNTGIRGHLTRHNLATTYLERGHLDAAEGHWRASLAERNDYVPAWLGLAEIAAKRDSIESLEKIIERLYQCDDTAIEAPLLQARLHLARKDFEAARQLLAKIIGGNPDELGPRVILSHVLLQEGCDWQAAEQALRDILAIDPQHKEAKQNLQVLLHQQQRESA